MGWVVVERRDRLELRHATKCQWVGDKFPTKLKPFALFSFSVCSSSLASKRSLWLRKCVCVCVLTTGFFPPYDLFISVNAVDVLLISTDHCLLPFLWPRPADRGCRSQKGLLQGSASGLQQWYIPAVAPGVMDGCLGVWKFGPLCVCLSVRERDRSFRWHW